jgi:hypothetical protein
MQQIKERIISIDILKREQQNHIIKIICVLKNKHKDQILRSFEEIDDTNVMPWIIKSKKKRFIKKELRW